MIIAKCPLRISLAGGSTDLQDFIDQNGYGSVISFPSTVYTYISIHKNNREKYIINYTKREEEKNIIDIKNDIAREVLLEFECEPVTITFNTDVHTIGSGLASSSSYLISAIAAVSKYKNIELSNFEICKIALKIERKFNPLTGYQDPYGCGIGSFKKFIFNKNKDPEVHYLEQKMFKNINMYLKYTGVFRSSTNVLNDVIKTDRNKILAFVNDLEKHIKNEDKENFLKCINDAWTEKKNSSISILQDHNLKKIDESLEKDPKILAHRLCGAGNGGYFLLFTEKTTLINDAIPVKIDQNGVEVYKI